MTILLFLAAGIIWFCVWLLDSILMRMGHRIAALERQMRAMQDDGR